MWIVGKNISKTNPLLFVVQSGIIHIYTRYNLAFSAAESLKGKMPTLLFENAC